MVEDQRQVITDDWIKKQLTDKRKHLLICLLLLSIILVIVSIFLISDINDAVSIIIGVAVLVIFIPIALYDLIF